MEEIIKNLAGYGVSIDTAALIVLLYRLEKRITILELTLKVFRNGLEERKQEI